MKNILFILCFFLSSVAISQDTTGVFGGISGLSSNIKGSSQIGSNVLVGGKFNRYLIGGSISIYNNLTSFDLLNQYNIIEKKNISVGPSINLGYGETSNNVSQNSLFYNKIHIDIVKTFILTPSLNLTFYKFLNLSVGYRFGTNNANINGLIYSFGFRYNIK